MIQATINRKPLTVPEGTSILEAARQVQVKIPTLCDHPDLPPTAACGICIVRLEGTKRMLRYLSSRILIIRMSYLSITLQTIPLF